LLLSVSASWVVMLCNHDGATDTAPVFTVFNIYDVWLRLPDECWLEREPLRGFLSVLTYGIPTHVIKLGDSHNQNDRCSLLRSCLRSRGHSFVGESAGDAARKIPREAYPKRSGAPSDLAARVILRRRFITAHKNAQP
jgi:hypothetical protein